MKKMIVLMLGVSFGLLLISQNYSNRVGAQSSYTETKIVATDGMAHDGFGYSVATDGNWVAIGARDDDPSGESSGSVYVFHWDGTNWNQEQKLTATDGVAYAHLGHAVAISGDVIVAGASRDDDNGDGSGSLYVFRWNGTSWTQEQKLTASDGANLDQFGNAVAINNDTIVVGAYQHDASATNSGAAYVYRWNGSNWLEEEKLTASDGAGNDAFGRSVSISNDVIIIGATGDDDQGNGSGSAYTYRWNGATWVEAEKLTASDGASGDAFGYALSLHGDVALIGAYLDDDLGSGSGSAYIYRWNGTNWVQEQKLTASNGLAGDQFSYSLSLSPNHAVIGAYANDELGNNAGSAYIFNWTGATWSETTKLTASDPRAGDLFGNAVASFANGALIAAKFDDDNGTNSGSAYVYTAQLPPTATPSPTHTATATPIPPTATSLPPSPTPLPTATAQPTNIFETSRQHMSFRLSYSVDLGDLDNDGDLDAIVGNYDTNRVWVNLGDGLFIDIGENLWGHGIDVDLGDFDLDGDLDVVFIRAAGGPGEMRTWFNNGDGTFENGQNFSPGQSLGDIALSNINGDQYIDLVATGGNGTSIWINDGTGRFERDHNQFNSIPPKGTGIALGDIDGDGDDDLVVAYHNGSSPNTLWRNDNGQFTTQTQELGIKGNQVEMADLNNDNHLDIFIIGSGMIWVNDGAGSFTNIQNVGSMTTTDIVLGDIDSDGDVDAIAPTLQGDFVWLNDGTGIFTNSGEELFTSGISGLGFKAIGDLDGDTDLDLFAVHNNSGSPTVGSPNIVWFNQTFTPENTPSP